MTEFDRIKKVCNNTLKTFCGSEDCDSPLDEFECDILAQALAEAITTMKETKNENKN